MAKIILFPKTDPSRDGKKEDTRGSITFYAVGRLADGSSEKIVTLPPYPSTNGFLPKVKEEEAKHTQLHEQLDLFQLHEQLDLFGTELIEAHRDKTG